ncbi:metallophosphoesterase [Pseudooceanicola nanhaiensis]|uniref:metallophosphoesterase n=1 Tax=Pseudooceanicola nanhaiensis TaxID=375761 RepID=UPI001CD6F89F|nr:metallophosphoesterase [Pseudooceanicola nanhaiensis]MCA0922349.1 metallophosphoesterase [Pseudooceanicola nanhaiensis]
MTRFLHITDLHVTAPETAGAGGEDAASRTLRKLVEVANRLTPAPDLIVASGDLTNTGDEASYRHVQRILEGLDVPVVMTLGNHDRREGFHAVFEGYGGAPDGPVDHEAVHAGLHVIALDTSIPGKIGGGLDEAQFAFLARALDRHGDLPKVLVLHHPPKTVRGGGLPWATLSEADSDRLQAMIAGRTILCILSGHVHYNRMSLWHGVPVVVTNGQQSTVDLTRTDALSLVEGTGFAICDLQEGGLQVTFVPLDEPRPIKEIPMERLRAFC